MALPGLSKLSPWPTVMCCWGPTGCSKPAIQEEIGMSWVGRWALPVSLCVLNLAVLACTSAPAQAPEATRTPTPASPEEQAANPDPGPSPSPEEESADTAPEPTPTSTPTSQLAPAAATTTPAATTTAPAATTTAPAATTTAPAATTTAPAATTTAPAVTTTAPAATTAAPAATTTAAVDDDSPVGDCFGGALSEDPLHCYVLEQAQAEGLIDILAMYDSNGPLYVSISQKGLSAELLRFAREKSYAFTEAWPELVPEEKYRRFISPCYDFPECYLAMTGLYADHPEYLLPYPSAYDGVLLLPGGDAGRREVPGWAGWRQLWPEGGSGARGASDSFDVSDVDMTNLPDGSSSTGFAGSHRGGGVTYVQVKNPPTDEAELHALRQAVNPCYDMDGVCTWTGADGITRTRRIEFIPVKYQIAELRRWAEILDRFALSAGNTIGITGAKVGTNQRSDGAVFLNGLTPVSSGNAPALRETIVVTARDVQRVADALPVLLPLLSIPVDAVGVVAHDWW